MEWHVRLGKLRKKLGYSRKRMAKLFGVSADHYRKYERGERGTRLLARHIWSLEFIYENSLLEAFEKEIDANGRAYHRSKADAEETSPR